MNLPQAIIDLYHNNIKPLVEVLKDDYRKYFVRDLALVGLLCGSSDGEYQSNEIFACILVISLINEDQEALQHLDWWDSSEQIREAYQNVVINAFDSIIDSEDYEFYTPVIFKGIDNEHNSDLFNPAIHLQ